MTFPTRVASVALVASFAAPSMAQTVPQTVPTLDNYSLPASRPTTVPIPPAPVIVLPTPTPAPLPSPSPTAVPTTRASTLRAEAPRAETAPTLTPAPPPSSVPTPTPTPTPSPSPAEPSPATLPTPGPAASTPVASVPRAARSEGRGGMLWWILPAVLALVIGLVLRRRRDAAEPEPEPVFDDAEPPEPAPSRTPRALVGLSLRPIRAGLNMLSATVEAELTVVNTGDAPATDIRVALALFSARAGQDSELAEHQTQPILRPAVPPFDLAAGETRTARVVVALPRAQITPMTAANRPMFVPLVAANCLYATVGLAAQTAQSFAIGIERVDSPKLAPFWLDTPARMHDHVAARPHTAALLR